MENYIIEDNKKALLEKINKLKDQLEEIDYYVRTIHIDKTDLIGDFVKNEDLKPTKHFEGIPSKYCTVISKVGKRESLSKYENECEYIFRFAEYYPGIIIMETNHVGPNKGDYTAGQLDEIKNLLEIYPKEKGRSLLEYGQEILDRFYGLKCDK